MNRFQQISKVLTEQKVLVQNFSYMSILQLINLVIPLITYPYLIKTLGKDIYGIIIYAQAIMAYFVVFVNFGFNISATKEISLNRNDKSKVDEIVSSVLIVKGLLFVFASVLISLVVYVLPNISGYENLFFLTMWMCLYEFLFPVWYFQGIEKMKYITFLNLFFRSVFLILIFVLIREKRDYILVPVINGIGAMIAGCCALYIVFVKHRVRFVIPKLEFILSQVKMASRLLLTSITGIVKDKSNTIIIGLTLSMKDVALYDLADKLVSLFSNLFYTVGNVVFPNYTKNKNTKLIKKILGLSFIASLLVYFFMGSVFAELIEWIISKDMLQAANIFWILGLLIIFRNLSYFLGAVFLIGDGYVKEVVWDMVYSTLVYLMLICGFYFCESLNVYTISISIVLSVVFEFLHRGMLCKKLKLLA